MEIGLNRVSDHASAPTYAILFLPLCPYNQHPQLPFNQYAHPPSRKISTSSQGRGRALPLLKHAKAPNKDQWSPVGGKLDMETGESPAMCHPRMHGRNRPPHLNGPSTLSIVAEKSFEARGSCSCSIATNRYVNSPQSTKATSPSSPPRNRRPPHPADRPLTALAFLRRHHKDFVMMRADCDPTKNLEIVIEENLRALN